MSRPPLRLVAEPLLDAHPLTTSGAPLLPSREAAGAGADIWEELDRAAAWVQDELTDGRLAAVPGPALDAAARERARRALRLLCVAARATWATLDVPGSPAPLRREDLPATVPAAALVRAMRQRLTAQTVEARSKGLPAADPADVLRALVSLERVETALEEDGVRSAMGQLTGATAMELLVEVAHDMRSPLGSILFLVERLRRPALGAEPRPASEDRTLALVYGAAFGLSSMVSDVMELARGGDRLAAGEPAPVVLADVLEAVAAIAAPLAEEKGLVLEMPELSREVRIGHGAALHRVLVNLVTNALKFTPAGRVSIQVEPRSRTRVAFTIQDTGRGIPRAVLTQLFQTFRRRAARDDYAFSSAGLGLAICQKLLSAMDAELQVESEEGVGTTFCFELELPPAGPVAA